MKYKNINWKIVKFDETKEFKKEFIEKYKLSKIEAVYCVNLNSCTYYAEITPSYNLTFICYTYEFNSTELNKLKESESEDLIYEATEELIKEEGIASENILVIHCKDLDKYLEKNKESVYDISDWITEEDYEDSLDENDKINETYIEDLIIEKYHANPIF